MVVVPDEGRTGFSAGCGLVAKAADRAYGRNQRGRSDPVDRRGERQRYFVNGARVQFLKQIDATGDFRRTDGPRDAPQSFPTWLA